MRKRLRFFSFTFTVRREGRKLQGIRRKACFFDQEALYHLSIHDGPLDNLLYVVFRHRSIPDGVGIDHEAGTMGACVQAPCIVRTNDAGKSVLAQFYLQQVADIGRTLVGATSLRVPRGTFIDAHENMSLESAHGIQYVVVTATVPLILARQAARSLNAKPFSSIKRCSISDGGKSPSASPSTVTRHHPHMPSPSQD